jgi:hypothetical protein
MAGKNLTGKSMHTGGFGAYKHGDTKTKKAKGRVTTIKTHGEPVINLKKGASLLVDPKDK